MLRKRSISIIFGLVIFAILTGCGGEKATKETNNVSETSSETAPNKSQETKEEPSSEFTKIDWYVDISFWSWNGEYGNDLTSQIMSEKTNTDINFIVAASDGGEQLSTMIASDSLPDILTLEGWWSAKSRNLSKQMGEEGYIVDLKTLAEEYEPELMENMRQDIFEWYSEKNGNTYVIPNHAYSSEDLEAGEKLVPNGSIVVRKDLLEQLGNPSMETPEDFINVCKRIRDEVKTYDGQEIIPLQLYEGGGNSMGWLSQYYATPYEDENGNFLYGFFQDNYKESIKLLNTAYREGLISDSNFSDTREMVNEKIASGRVFTGILAAQDFRSPFESLYEKDNNAVYQAVITKNSKNEDPVMSDIRGFGWLVSAVSKNSDNLPEIANLFNYLLSEEGLIDMAYGKEGVTFDWVENNTKIQFTDEYEDAIKNNDTKKYGLGAMSLLDNYAFRRKFEIDSTLPKTLATSDLVIKEPLKQYAYDFNAASLKNDPNDPRRDEIQQISVKRNNYLTPIILEMITASSDEAFEQIYADAVVELEQLGIEKVIEYNNDGFQEAKKALGIERSWPPFLN